MSKIYASFDTAAAAEKAAGALLDYGVNSDDISLIRGGSEEDFENWRAKYGETPPLQSDQPDLMAMNTPTSGTEVGMSPDPNAPITGYGTTVTGEPDSMLGENDPHYKAAEIVDRTEYVDELSAPNSGYDERQDWDDKDNSTNLSAKTGISTTTPADAGAGAAKGAGIGLGIGIIAALASIFVPGLGLIVGGGALATAIGGAVATTGAGAIAGAVTGYLKDQGVEEAVARDYEATLSSGGSLLEVNVPSGDVDEATAREVLNKYGAANVGAYASPGYMA